MEFPRHAFGKATRDEIAYGVRRLKWKALHTGRRAGEKYGIAFAVSWVRVQHAPCSVIASKEYANRGDVRSISHGFGREFRDLSAHACRRVVDSESWRCPQIIENSGRHAFVAGIEEHHPGAGFLGYGLHHLTTSGQQCQVMVHCNLSGQRRWQPVPDTDDHSNRLRQCHPPGPSDERILTPETEYHNW